MSEEDHEENHYRDTIVAIAAICAIAYFRAELVELLFRAFGWM